MANKSDAKATLEFYIQNALAASEHITNITAGVKAEIIIEDVISNLLQPSALRAIIDYAREQGVEIPLPPLRLWVDLAVSGCILQGNFDVTDEKDTVCEINESLLLIHSTHDVEGQEK